MDYVKVSKNNEKILRDVVGDLFDNIFKINKLIEIEQKIHEKILDVEQAEIVIAKNKFKEMGGCTTCNGRGWIVAWDTLDSLSGCYAEYKSCTNPNCNASITGINHGFHTKYDKFKGVRVNPLSIDGQNQIDYYNKILNSVKEKMYYEEEIRTPKNERVVIVFKGRKVPIGTMGEVFWIGYGRNPYGTERVGFKDKNDTVFWSSTENVIALTEDEVEILTDGLSNIQKGFVESLKEMLWEI